MSRAIAFLGGKCVICGVTENLEIDHIDRGTKAFDISANTCLSWARIEDELSKCQALCATHHKEKSDKENSVEHGNGLTGKKNCRCELCGPLKTTWHREYMRKRRAARSEARNAVSSKG